MTLTENPQSDSLPVIQSSTDTISKVLPTETLLDDIYKKGDTVDSMAKPIVKIKRKSLFRSMVGVKTNLLYWAGAIPNVDNKHVTPNLELQCYLAKRFSLNMNGLFAYCPDKSSHDHWGISTIVIEPRFWYTNDGFFTGAYIGPYGLYGDPAPTKMNLCLYNSDGSVVNKQCSSTDGYWGDILSWNL